MKVWAKAVTELKGAFIKISFDSAKTGIFSDTPGAFLNTNGASVTYLSEKTSNYIEINTSALGGDPRGVSGSGILAIIKFVAIETVSSTDINISDYTLRDLNYDDISATTVDLTVKIE